MQHFLKEIKIIYLRSDCNWKIHIQVAARSGFALDTIPHFIHLPLEGYLASLDILLVKWLEISV